MQKKKQYLRVHWQKDSKPKPSTDDQGKQLATDHICKKRGKCFFLSFVGGRGCEIGATGESASFTSCFHVFSLFFTEEKSMKEQIRAI